MKLIIKIIFGVLIALALIGLDSAIGQENEVWLEHGNRYTPVSLDGNGLMLCAR